MTRESWSWKNPAVPDSFREEQARKLAEAEARCRKATPAQKLALALKAENHPLPEWLKPHRQSLIDMAIRTWEGGADQAAEIRHIRISIAAGPRSPEETPKQALARAQSEQVSQNQRKRYFEELQRFMDFLSQG